jgi:hypothetical protein
MDNALNLSFILTFYKKIRDPRAIVAAYFKRIFGMFCHSQSAGGVFVPAGANIVE